MSSARSICRESAVREAIGLAPWELFPATVDLSGAGFCDSTGLSALVNSDGTAQAGGTIMIISSPTSDALDLRRITGPDQVLTICDTPETRRPPDHRARSRLPARSPSTPARARITGAGRQDGLDTG